MSTRIRDFSLFREQFKSLEEKEVLEMFEKLNSMLDSPTYNRYSYADKLSIACKNKNFDHINFFIKVDKENVNRPGLTYPCSKLVAIKVGSLEILKILVENSDFSNLDCCINSAVVAGHTEIFNYILDNSSMLLKEDNFLTLMKNACYYERMDIFDIIYDLVKNSENLLFTVFNFCASLLLVEPIKYFLTKNIFTKNAIMLVVKNSFKNPEISLELVKILYYYSDINHVEDGINSLFYCIVKCNDETSSLLADFLFETSEIICDQKSKKIQLLNIVKKPFLHQYLPKFIDSVGCDWCLKSLVKKPFSNDLLVMIIEKMETQDSLELKKLKSFHNFSCDDLERLKILFPYCDINLDDEKKGHILLRSRGEILENIMTKINLGTKLSQKYVKNKITPKDYFINFLKSYFRHIDIKVLFKNVLKIHPAVNSVLTQDFMECLKQELKITYLPQ